MILDLSTQPDEGLLATYGVDEPGLHDDLAHMARALGLVEPEVSLVLCDDEVMADLNATWRGKEGPTDVLSFPQQEPPVQGGLLGDLVVSLATAVRQAEEVGHDLRSELRVLLAHGLCHLLGHDHHDPAEAQAMAAAEATVLAAWRTTGLVGRAAEA